MGCNATRPNAFEDERSLNANAIDPRRFFADMPPCDLTHFDGEASEFVGQLAGEWQLTRSKKFRLCRVLEHSPKRAHLLNGSRRTRFILFRAKE